MSLLQITSTGQYRLSYLERHDYPSNQGDLEFAVLDLLDWRGPLRDTEIVSMVTKMPIGMEGEYPSESRVRSIIRGLAERGNIEILSN